MPGAESAIFKEGFFFRFVLLLQTWFSIARNIYFYSYNVFFCHISCMLAASFDKETRYTLRHPRRARRAPSATTLSTRVSTERL